MGEHILRYGVNKALEAVADQLLHDSLVGVTSMEEKKDILTPWKQKDRLDHEVYLPSGSPDAATRRGVYHRAWNPRDRHLNSSDGVARARRMPDSLSAFAQENGTGSFAPPDSD